MTIAISASGLRKSFGDKTVLDGIDLAITSGSVFALLGPNGAGKTTTVKILSTLVKPDGGTATVAGHDLATDPKGVRSAIGVTGQFSAVDGLMTGEENLMLMADLHHLNRRQARRTTAELLHRFDIADAANKPANTYSGGMKRRLDLAMTLVGSPRIIFLDEPTTGLDPRSRRGMWQIVEELVSDGVTIFLTTQYLEEADQLADHIAVLDGGRLVAEGTSQELKRRIPGGHVVLHFADDAAVTAATGILTGAIRDGNNHTLRVPGDGSIAALRGLLDQLDAASIDVGELSVHTPDLDDVFLALTGQSQPETTR
ncbi:ABC-2 type transport system ATP-binding protein [Stackebrandtia endophytica]|uniref:ABC-2 type transport system ATP-binding protein n=1 Tax=Stackebrandtia endophytica TaxID=1496996 RepID=A0A543AXL3_9ACTN|nr:ATP-binding cassette domain-containing protein [Stackebrandtia endophytica]TQL77290.1 ABC-2 type transport system ATP-binding protein [Stackebrandtia endophytica]